MLETKDLILRPGLENDWAQLYKNLWSRESVFQYLFSRPSLTPEAGKKKTAAYAQMHTDVPTEFFVVEKSSREAIGIAGIKFLTPDTATITDIAIGPDFWGKGYGKQILTFLTRLAFSYPEIMELHYSCFTENEISKKLALSCGFVYSHSQETMLPKSNQTITLDHYIRRKENV